MPQLPALPVDGLNLDFRDLDERSQRIAQYAISLKILERLPLALTDPEREEIMRALNSSTTASNATQDRLRTLIAGLPTT